MAAHKDAQREAIAGLSIWRVIGSGNAATVYLAEKGEKSYALKVSKSRDEDGSILLGFRREASLTCLIADERVIKILDVGLADNHPYMIMEFQPQDTLEKFLARGALTVQETLTIGIQVAEVLGRIHSLGIVHRDIQPSNIIWDPDQKKIKLLDFGLATTAFTSTNGTAIGTVNYMSPEQSGGLRRAVDGRSDLYGLGAVLFHALTGTPPYIAGSAIDTIRLHVTAPIPEISEMCKNLPADLAATIRQLLAKDPDDRISSASELATRLKMIANGLPIDHAAPSMPHAGHDQVPFIGRDHDLATVQGLWEETLGNHGKMILVEGSAGFGKSRLVRAATLKTPATGFIEAAGKCKAGVPFAPWQKITGMAISWLQTHSGDKTSSDLLQQIMDQHGMALEQLSGQIEKSPINRQEPEITREEIVIAVAHTITTLAVVAGGMYIIIDDIQWLDESSRDVLLRISAHSRQYKLMIAATARNDSESRSGLELFLRIFGDQLDARIELAAMERPDADRLLEASLGGLAIDPWLAEKVFKKAAGNPFAIGEVSRNLIANGVVAPSWGKIDVDRDRFNQLDLPSNVVDLVKKRVTTLPVDVQTVLTYAAVVGGEFDERLLMALPPLSTCNIPDALSQGALGFFVQRATGHSWRFVHDRVHETFLSLAETNDVRAMNHIIARVLYQSQAPWRGSRYQTASHFWLGDPDENPDAAYQAFCAATQEALAAHHIQRAGETLSWIFAHGTRHGYDLSIHYENYGEVSGRLGKKSEAVEYLKRAALNARPGYERARIYGKLSRVYVENLETDLGMTEMLNAFREVKWRFPSITHHGLQAIFNGLRGLFANETKIGYGTLTGTRREQAEVIVSLHEQAGFLKFFDLDTLTGIIAALRVFHLGHALGDSDTLVRLYCVVLTLIGALQNRALVNGCHKRVQAIADRVRNPLLHGHVAAYRLYALSFTGAELEAQELALEILAEHKESLSAENFVYTCGIYISSMTIRGRPTEAMQIVRMGIEHLSRQSEGSDLMRDHYLTWFYSYGMAALMTLGEIREATMFRDKMEAYFASHPNDHYHWGVHLLNILHSYLEQGEYSDVVEKEFERHGNLQLFIPVASLQIRYFYVYKAFIRLNQLRLVQPSGQKEARRRFKSAMLELRLGCDTDLLRSFLHTLWGAYYSLIGKDRASDRNLTRGEHYALKTNNVNALYEIKLSRARRQKSLGRHAMTIDLVKSLMADCHNHGWNLRLKHLMQEFSCNDLSRTTSHPGQSATISIASTHAMSAGKSSTGELVMSRAVRTIDSLIRVSLAASQSLNPQLRAVTALDEVLKILGGERALLFLASENSEALEFFAGRGSHSQNITSVTGHSSKVVDEVWRKQKAIIVSGVAEAESLGSQSIVAHDIRSIMAAPVSVNARQIGVIYLDTHLARGMFNEDDFNILASISTQIAIAIDAAQAAQSEITRQALEKDMEITGSVQKLLIPANMHHDEERFALALHFQPAARSGGDWIWYDVQDNGKVTILLGDVMGHGPGPAIITGLAAGVYRATRGSGASIQAFTDALHRCLADAARGTLHMVFVAVEYDPAARTALIVNCGSPGICLFQKSVGKSKRLMLPSTPLGIPSHEHNIFTLSLDAGDRLILCTDGFFEFHANGRPFGINALMRVFDEMVSLPPNEARDHILSKLGTLVKGRFDDDLSMAILDIK